MDITHNSLDWLRIAYEQSVRGSTRIAVIAAHAAASEACERYMETQRGFAFNQNFSFTFGMGKLREFGVITPVHERQLLELHEARNAAAHAPYSAPSDHDLTFHLSAASTLLSLLGSPVWSLAVARVTGIYLEVSSSQQPEIVRLAPFRADHLDIATVAPIDWPGLEEREAYLRFDSRPETPVYSRGFSVVASGPPRKVLTFRLVRLDAPRGNMADLVAEDVPFLSSKDILRTLEMRPVVDDELVPGAEVSSYVLTNTFWSGYVVRLSCGSDSELILSLHQEPCYASAWSLLCREVVRNTSVLRIKTSLRSRNEIVDACTIHARQLRARERFSRPSEQLLCTGELLCLDNKRIPPLAADFVISEGVSEIPTVAGCIEWPSGLTAPKVARWRALERFSRAVWVYVSSRHTDHLWQFRGDFGRKVLVFAVEHDRTLPLAIERVEL